MDVQDEQSDSVKNSKSMYKSFFDFLYLTRGALPDFYEGK